MRKKSIGRVGLMGGAGAVLMGLLWIAPSLFAQQRPSTAE